MGDKETAAALVEFMKRFCEGGGFLLLGGAGADKCFVIEAREIPESEYLKLDELLAREKGSHITADGETVNF